MHATSKLPYSVERWINPETGEVYWDYWYNYQYANDPAPPENLLEFATGQVELHQKLVRLESSGEATRLRAVINARRLDVGQPSAPGMVPVKPGMETEVMKAKTAKILKAVEWLKSHRLRASAKLEEPVTRLFLASKPVSTPGNITNLISKSKTGKTATVGGIVGAIVAASEGNLEADTFGFSASDPSGMAVVLFDTEQSEFDAYSCHVRALDRAGTKDDPDWLHAHTTAGTAAQDLRMVLRPAIENAANAHGGVFAVILDGVADFVSDVNDPKESNAFVAELHGLAIEFDCAIICVIHSNESKMSGDDGRGHLGKQLTRKAESNLLLKKVGDVTTITSEKQRKAPITEADGIAFAWSDTEGRHVSCKSVSDSRDDAKRAKLYDQAEAVFIAAGATSLSWSALRDEIAKAEDLGKSGAGKRFDAMNALGVITRNTVGHWSLAPATPHTP